MRFIAAAIVHGSSVDWYRPIDKLTWPFQISWITRVKDLWAGALERPWLEKSIVTCDCYMWKPDNNVWTSKWFRNNCKKEITPRTHTIYIRSPTSKNYPVKSTSDKLVDQKWHIWDTCGHLDLSTCVGMGWNEMVVWEKFILSKELSGPLRLKTHEPVGLKPMGRSKGIWKYIFSESLYEPWRKFPCLASAVCTLAPYVCFHP